MVNCLLSKEGHKQIMNWNIFVDHSHCKNEMKIKLLSIKASEKHIAVNMGNRDNVVIRENILNERKFISSENCKMSD